MRRKALRWFRLIGGTLLIIAGIIGGFIPILQGWMFVVAGLALMAPESSKASRVLEWAKSKLAKTRAKENRG